MPILNWDILLSLSRSSIATVLFTEVVLVLWKDSSRLVALDVAADHRVESGWDQRMQKILQLFLRAG
jgi:hypothetical protein